MREIFDVGPPLSSHRRPGLFRRHFGVVMGRSKWCTKTSLSCRSGIWHFIKIEINCTREMTQKSLEEERELRKEW
jgi:hypothetical protein